MTAPRTEAEWDAWRRGAVPARPVTDADWKLWLAARRQKAPQCRPASTESDFGGPDDHPAAETGLGAI